ncbi:MAG TPA: ImmA/IrrE family metallo-endopeptidase [Bacteroidia bacterium]|nr:ImmA/IrrE family metallo-endopeptidase [Bacteroidia bacterium]
MTSENIKMNVFPTRLAAAREMAGLSQQALANLSALSKQAISKFENGHLKPSGDAVTKLAGALHKPEDYFFQQVNEGSAIRLVSIALREEINVIQEEFDLIKKDTEDYLFRLIELEKIADSKQEFKNPIEDLQIETRKDIQKAVKQLRKKWNLGNIQIANVVTLLEAKGIKVYEVERSEQFNGFAAWAGRIPIIVINSGIKEVTRVRFTALHELGHIVLNFIDELDNETIERLCDAFSGELLFPQEAIVIELGRSRTKITIEELKYLKEKYGISVLAIMFSAYKAAVIDLDTYRRWKMYYNQWMAEEKDFGKFASEERPQRFNRLLFGCLIEDRISIGKASVLAKMKEGDLKKRFHSLEKQHMN